MKQNENGALAPTSQNAPQNLPVTNVTQNPPKSQAPDGGKKKHKSDGWLKNRKPLVLDSKVATLALKLYAEQLKYGWDYTCKQIQATNPKDFQVIAICHNRDTYADEGHFWKPAIEKEHYHIILRCTDRKKRIRVRKLLKDLGIEYRPQLDDELWANHGVETVGNFAGYATYLTHETETAVNEGKELYSMDELVSNLTTDEIQKIRDGYIRVAESNKKLSADDWTSIDETAYKLGYELKNFSEWYDSQPFNVRSNTKVKTIRESYERGVNKRIAEGAEMLRLCVFIHGEPNSGKTYASEKALSGKRYFTVKGGGTGKFDNLRVDHQAIIIDDDVCPYLLNMTDNYICRAYKRQNNNPAWTGQYFVVTSNYTFFEWLEMCKLGEKHFEAAYSRFYLCEIKQKEDGTNYLALSNPSKRGSLEEQKQRAEMFKDFQNKFNDTMAGYHPQSNTYDYSGMIDESFQATEEPEEEKTAAGTGTAHSGFETGTMSKKLPCGNPYNPYLRMDIIDEKILEGMTATCDYYGSCGECTFHSDKRKCPYTLVDINLFSEKLTPETNRDY